MIYTDRYIGYTVLHRGSGGIVSPYTLYSMRALFIRIALSLSLSQTHSKIVTYDFRRTRRVYDWSRVTHTHRYFNCLLSPDYTHARRRSCTRAHLHIYIQTRQCCVRVQLIMTSTRRARGPKSVTVGRCAPWQTEEQYTTVCVCVCNKTRRWRVTDRRVAYAGGRNYNRPEEVINSFRSSAPDIQPVGCEKKSTGHALHLSDHHLPGQRTCAQGSGLPSRCTCYVPVSSRIVCGIFQRDSGTVRGTTE